jgi:MFS family permease
VALFLLGLGWNFCFVGGSTLLSDHLSPAERARTQGVNDLLIGLTTAAASLGSGLIFASTSFVIMAMIGIALALVPFGLALWWLATQRAPASALV